MHTHDLSVQVLTRVLFGKEDIAVSVYLNDFSFSLFANCFSEMRLTLQSTRYVVLELPVMAYILMPPTATDTLLVSALGRSHGIA